ncbi:MAG TPA: hypothetical protein VID47_05830 [Actinomycetota bacterium]
MPALSDRLQEGALELAWSLWAELGVSGWRRRHVSHAIDPEPLILFTAFLGDTDPRLRDEATDWCIGYGRYVSAVRLRNLLSKALPEERRAFGPFAATINAHSTLRWPGSTDPRQYQRTGRARIPDFARPSLVVLRCRALFGVGARAEILRTYLSDSSSSLSAADLAHVVGYTKRNVADALEALKMGGLLEVIPQRNQLRYRSARTSELADLVGDLPGDFPNWRSIFRILETMLSTARRTEGLNPSVRGVEAARALHELTDDMRLAGLKAPPFADAGEAWARFESWAVVTTEAWASAAV